MVFSQWRSGDRGRGALVLAFAIASGFVLMQGVASREGKRVLAETIRKQDPATWVLDVAMSSFPSNPFCWIFATVDANESEDRYTLRRGLISTSPAWMPVAACPASFARDAIGPAPTPGIGVAQEKQFSLSKLRERRETDCHFEAWMRFARAPWLTDTEATDVRFATGSRGNFTTMRFEDLRDETCSRHVPQWDFPRQDLLTPLPEKTKQVE